MKLSTAGQYIIRFSDVLLMAAGLSSANAQTYFDENLFRHQTPESNGWFWPQLSCLSQKFCKQSLNILSHDHSDY